MKPIALITFTLLILYILYSECITLPFIIKKNKKICYAIVIGLYFYNHKTIEGSTSGGPDQDPQQGGEGVEEVIEEIEEGIETVEEEVTEEIEPVVTPPDSDTSVAASLPPPATVQIVTPPASGSSVAASLPPPATVQIDPPPASDSSVGAGGPEEPDCADDVDCTAEAISAAYHSGDLESSLRCCITKPGGDWTDRVTSHRIASPIIKDKHDRLWYTLNYTGKDCPYCLKDDGYTIFTAGDELEVDVMGDVNHLVPAVRTSINASPPAGGDNAWPNTCPGDNTDHYCPLPNQWSRYIGDVPPETGTNTNILGGEWVVPPPGLQETWSTDFEAMPNENNPRYSLDSYHKTYLVTNDAAGNTNWTADDQKTTYTKGRPPPYNGWPYPKCQYPPPGGGYDPPPSLPNGWTRHTGEDAKWLCAGGSFCEKDIPNTGNLADYKDSLKLTEKLPCAAASPSLRHDYPPSLVGSGFEDSTCVGFYTERSVNYPWQMTDSYPVELMAGQYQAKAPGEWAVEGKKLPDRDEPPADYGVCPAYPGWPLPKCGSLPQDENPPPGGCACDTPTTICPREDQGDGSTQLCGQGWESGDNILTMGGVRGAPYTCVPPRTDDDMPWWGILAGCGVLYAFLLIAAMVRAVSFGWAGIWAIILAIATAVLYIIWGVMIWLDEKWFAAVVIVILVALALFATMAGVVNVYAAYEESDYDLGGKLYGTRMGRRAYQFAENIRS